MVRLISESEINLKVKVVSTAKIDLEGEREGAFMCSFIHAAYYRKRYVVSGLLDEQVYCGGFLC